MKQHGGLRGEKVGREVLWSIQSEEALDAIKWRAEARDGDGRLRPRLGRVPVDVEAEVVKIMAALSRPASLDEIVAAWGRLRETRKTASVAGDLTRLIEADRKRARRAMKLAGLVSA